MKTIRFDVTDEEHHRYQELVNWFYGGWVHDDGSPRVTLGEVANKLVQREAAELQRVRDASIRRKREEQKTLELSIIPFPYSLPRR